ncbi:BON domain-containing protein [Vibrio breoganii]
MLYTRKLSLYVATILASLLLSGCAGMFVSDSSDIVNDDRSTREIWSDNNIEFEAAALGNKPPFSGKVRVAASSFRGKVVLIGQAPTEELSIQVEEHVEKIAGVKKVYNQLRIQPVINVSQMSRDSWITAKVKSALIGEDKLKGVSVKVITENSEVFLFGYVTPESADIATDTARNVSGVKLVIRGFEIADLATLEAKKAPAPTSDAKAPAAEAPVVDASVEDAALEQAPLVDSAADESDIMEGDVVIDRSGDIVEESIEN